uniref:Uncharacterized protein n=1 Tax=Escherichia coli TaxID=562 RepID=A0A2H5C5L9_ECOLX|nr:hypothetical protein PCOV24_00158 [Escherichia coli]
MISTSFLSHSQSCASRTTLLSGFTAFSDDASRLINITSSRVCMSGIVSGGAEGLHFRRPSHALPVWHGQNQAASTSCWRIQVRSAFLSRAAIRSPDNALLIWLRTRLSRSSCASSGEKPPGISVRNSLSCTVAAADQSATALQLSVHNGQYSHWRWFLYHSAVPPDHYHRYCRATATEVASTREPDIVRLISSYCVLQLVGIIHCSSARTCTGAPRPASPASKISRQSGSSCQKNRSNDDSDGKRPHHPQKIVSRSCSSTTPDQRDNQLPTVAGV